MYVCVISVCACMNVGYKYRCVLSFVCMNVYLWVYVWRCMASTWWLGDQGPPGPPCQYLGAMRSGIRYRVLLMKGQSSASRSRIFSVHQLASTEAFSFWFKVTAEILCPVCQQQNSSSSVVSQIWPFGPWPELVSHKKSLSCQHEENPWLVGRRIWHFGYGMESSSPDWRGPADKWLGQ